MRTAVLGAGLCRTFTLLAWDPRRCYHVLPALVCLGSFRLTDTTVNLALAHTKACVAQGTPPDHIFYGVRGTHTTTRYK